jgi:hypothetical protein
VTLIAHSVLLTLLSWQQMAYSLQRLFGVSHEVESCTSQLAKEAIKARKGVCQRIIITLPVGELASEQSTTW